MIENYSKLFEDYSVLDSKKFNFMKFNGTKY